MVNTTVRGIPDEVYDRLRRQAEREHRSINAQIVHVLERATEPKEES